MDATHALTRINTFYIVCRPSFVDKLYRRNSTKPRWAPDATKGWPLIPVPNRALESMKHILIEAERPAISFLKGSNRVPRLSCDLLVERLESGFVADFTKMPGLHNISHLRHGITGSPEIGQLVSGFVRSAPAVIEELLNTSPLGLRTLQQIVQIMVDMGVPPDDTFQSPSPHQNELPDQDYVRQMGFGSLHSFRITGSRSVQQHTPSFMCHCLVGDQIEAGNIKVFYIVNEVTVLQTDMPHVLNPQETYQTFDLKHRGFDKDVYGVESTTSAGEAEYREMPAKLIAKIRDSTVEFDRSAFSASQSKAAGPLFVPDVPPGSSWRR
ncbi:hypothetical protein PRZ48_008998 [Zasmidium cellare]|uniref:Uncharacterized protein n=1 Tax=Zasmidium cellare TaxID=395010 RepID=A0ABR0EH11_ZASCE|nr:hypothetical protein PRZ48_008998 [Zasmidium cellare]